EFDASFFRLVVGPEVFIETTDCLVFVGVAIGDEHREFVAAEPGNDVCAAEAAVEYVGGADESDVAFAMSKLVVDLLHAVEVDEEEQQALFFATREIEIR